MIEGGKEDEAKDKKEKEKSKSRREIQHCKQGRISV